MISFFPLWFVSVNYHSKLWNQKSFAWLWFGWLKTEICLFFLSVFGPEFFVLWVLHFLSRLTHKVLVFLKKMIMSESCCWHYNGFHFCLFFPGPKRWRRWAICLGKQGVLEETLHRKGAFSILVHLPLAKLKYLPLNKDVTSFFFFLAGGCLQSGLHCTIHRPWIWFCFYWWQKCCLAGGFWRLGKGHVPFFYFLLIRTAKIVTCDFSVWALAESCPAGQGARSTERRSESLPSRTATSGRASQATRSWSLEQGSHFNSFSLYRTLNCSLYILPITSIA